MVTMEGSTSDGRQSVNQANKLIHAETEAENHNEN